MSKDFEKLERNENEELKKSTNPESEVSEVSDLQESENSLQEEDSTEEITKEEAEEKTEETAEEVHEDELMEVPSSSGGKWLVAIFIAVIIAVIIGVVIIIMCRPKEKEPEPIVAVEQVQEEPKVEEVKPTEEEVVNEEEQLPEEVEQQEEVKQTLDEWVNTLSISEVKYCVWNESKGTGIVLENNQTYELEDGDIILIYKPKEDGIESMTIPNETSINGVDVRERYNILDLAYYNKETEFQTTIKSKSGQEYKFDFSIVLPSSVEIKSIKELSGDEWEKIISKEKPAFIVWNDTTGEKTMIQDGEEYQLKEGDEVAIYHGINRYLSDIIQPAGCQLDYRTYCTRLVYASSNEPIEFKAQLASFDDANDVVEVSFTLLPME